MPGARNGGHVIPGGAGKLLPGGGNGGGGSGDMN